MKKAWLIVLMAMAPAAHADDQPLTKQLSACQKIAQSEARLACFDAIASEENPAVDAVQQTIPTPAEKAAAIASLECEARTEAHLRQDRYLDRKWHLSKECEEDAFLSLQPHRQNYIVASMSSNPNDVAQTPSQLATAPRGLQNKDVQFQISLKTQLMPDIPLVNKLPWVETSRLWAAYTQRSYWQVFDSGNSERFRETNFAPELILSIGLDDSRPRWMPRMLNLGALHESNGREDPFSRSWNRVYLEAGWQFGEEFSLIARPWWAPSSDMSDNPDIDRYLGYGDLTLRWDSVDRDKWAQLLVRNNLRSDNKGYAKFNFNYAISEHLSWYFMLSSGYGESLLDYNHHQNTIGLGFAVGE